MMKQTKVSYLSLHLPVSALTLAMQLSQQAPDVHLAVGCGDFIFIHS